MPIKPGFAKNLTAFLAVIEKAVWSSFAHVALVAMGGDDPAGSPALFEHGKTMIGAVQPEFVGDDQAGKAAADNKGLVGIVHFKPIIFRVLFAVAGDAQQEGETLDSQPSMLNIFADFMEIINGKGQTAFFLPYVLCKR